jgi:hypothetical protein
MHLNSKLERPSIYSVRVPKPYPGDTPVRRAANYLATYLVQI